MGGRGQIDQAGWVGAEGAGLEVGAEDSGLVGSDAESSGSEVGGGDLAGLAVEAGWGGCRFLFTLRATLESKLNQLSSIFRFSVQPGSRLHLPV